MPEFILSLIPYFRLATQLIAALLFGAAIGFERQVRQRMAGLRTNALVALGSASFVTLPLLIEGEQSPTRMAAQVISGIGFLGGGVILREGFSIQGLNTAATLWGSAAVGVLAGSGFIPEASIVTVLVLMVNLLLRPLAHKINRRPKTPTTEVEEHYTITIVCGSADEVQVRALLLQMVNRGPLQLRRLQSKDTDSGAIRVQAELSVMGRQDTLLETIVSRLSLEASVTEVGWETQTTRT
jgi:putative Mg2+ transporter-C (MgtC) family protein